MKRLILLFAFLSMVTVGAAQLKIDSNYVFVVNVVEFKNGAYINTAFGPENIAIKQIATGKTCAIASAEWIFSIQGNIFRDTKAADIKTHLAMCKPKDLLFIEKIKLGNGCFVYRGQIAFGVQ